MIPLAIAVDQVSKPWAIVLGVIFAVIALVLAFASWTRWGQNKPLTKCVALAVLAHVWLLMYAYGTRVLPTGLGDGGGDGGPGPAVAFEMIRPAEATDGEDSQEAEAEPQQTPAWAAPIAATLPELPEAEIPPPPVEVAEMQEPPQKLDLPDSLLPPPDAAEDLPPSPRATSLADALAAAEAEPAAVDRPPEPDAAPPSPEGVVDSESLPVDAPAPEPVPAPEELAVAAQPVGLRRFDEVPLPQTPEQASIPEIYRLRFSPMRSQLAEAGGGDAGTEAAVDAALGYLAASQRRDGSWSSAHTGGGRETRTLGEDRGGAGGKADTAITGLALLAMLGGGHTPRTGTYAANAAAAAEYLAASQMPSGDLAGPLQVGSTPDVRFARMYSHGIALLALAECYALTREPSLREPVIRGASYTLQAQNPYTGGWRYDARYTGDPGDLSQFGWQAMALQSCRRAGFTLPADHVAKMLRFLESVAAGPSRGLAVYRPVPGQRPSAAMTAEALASRHLLGLRVDPAAAAEASQLLLQNLPGRSEENLYYWYYATLGLHQQGGEAWQRWNAAMKRHLVDSQVRGGPSAGSWDPNCIWGGYGGRVYSTSLACMCLEVYYRYIPLYRTAAAPAEFIGR